MRWPRMNKSVLKLSILTFSSLILFLTIGCSSNSVKEDQDKNIITIENVLEKTFIGPDKEFQDIMDNVEGETQKTEEKVIESLESYAQYIKDLFEPYFTNQSYEEYVGIYGTTFLEKAYRSNYQLNIKEVNYEKTKSDESIYNFSFKIQYKKVDSEQWEEDTIRGQANLNDNHKIKRILIRNLEFLNNLK